MKYLVLNYTSHNQDLFPFIWGIANYVRFVEINGKKWLESVRLSKYCDVDSFKDWNK